MSSSSIKYATNKAKELLEIEESILINIQNQGYKISESKKKIKNMDETTHEGDLILKRMLKKWWKR